MFSELKKKFGGKKILIVGLGEAGGGAGNTRFFYRLGARVKITDKKTKEKLKNQIKKLPKGISFSLGGHKLRDFLESDFILKNPAVSWDLAELKAAQKQGVQVLTDSQIFFDFCPTQKIIGVTGTKGKTTACYLLKHVLSRRYKILLTGNIFGHSILEDLLKTPKYDFVVYELSSFALENLKTSPHIAVLTNIFPDHLERYKSFRGYVFAKKNIVRFQKETDFAVFPNSQKRLFRQWQKTIKSKTVYYDDIFLAGKFYGRIKALLSPSSLGAALKTAEILKISKKKMLSRLKTFNPETGRLEILGGKNGITIINDSMATNPGAAAFGIQQTIKVFKVPPHKIILIAGGVDKGFSGNDYRPFFEKLKKLKQIILLPGSASEKIKLQILPQGGIPLRGTNNKLHITNVSSLKEALNQSLNIAVSGDIILFSPAAASFNLFRNAYDRSAQFKTLARHFLTKGR